MRVVPLKQDIEDSFLKFVEQDAIRNWFAILDLKYHRDKTNFWIALEGLEILGYMLEYDGEHLTIRGDARCTAELLKRASLTEPRVNIEPWHLPIVETFYEPIKPIYRPDRGKITTFLIMEVHREHFKPIIKYRPRKLTADEFDAFKRLHTRFVGEIAQGPIEHERIDGIVRNLFKYSLLYGTYEGGELVSFACGACGTVVGNLSTVGPVYTSPEFRARGHAKSACSAVVSELLGKTERATLVTAQSNVVAIGVYEKIGFTKTGHKFLSFFGHRTRSPETSNREDG